MACHATAAKRMPYLPDCPKQLERYVGQPSANLYHAVSPVAISPRPANDKWLCFKDVSIVHAAKLYQLSLVNELYQGSTHLDRLHAACTVRANKHALHACVSWSQQTLLGLMHHGLRLFLLPFQPKALAPGCRRLRRLPFWLPRDLGFFIPAHPGV